MNGFMETRCYVIAEAGVNHNGDLGRARAMIDAAADAGADAVKFQTFDPKALVTPAAAKADYQAAQTGGAETQLQMLERLVLPRNAHAPLMAHCRDRGIDFLSTPFDFASLGFLADDLGLPILKISSGDAVNGPFLLAAARTGKRLILSTGMCTLNEVAAALDVVAWGLTGKGDPSGVDALAGFRDDVAAAPLLRETLCVLHCVTDYPAAAADTNLLAMRTLADTFGLSAGLSDHSAGTAISLAAVALDARVIEKHFTLDRTLPGPDHAASLEPNDLKAMIDGIREIEAALGDGVKTPRPSERANAAAVRKSVVATAPIAAGEALGPGNIGCLRPGGGRPPMDYWSLLGQAATRAYAAGDMIE